MARFFGYNYTVSVYVFLKVAMAKSTNEEEIDEASFDATCRLYEHESDVKVIDNRLMEIEQNNKYFTVANVGLDLRIKVVAHDYEEAYAEAEGVAYDVVNELPAGVAWYDCEAYDSEEGDPAVDWDWVVGE